MLHQGIGWFFIVLLVIIVALPVQAQVQLEDLAYQSKPIEPGSSLVVAGTTDVPVGIGRAALGDSSIAFKFKATDIDPIVDDTSDVEITCVLIQNLGTATGGLATDDISYAMVLDQDGYAPTGPLQPTITGSVDPTAGATPGCASMARTAPDAQVAWEIFIDFPHSVAPETPTILPLIIPDDGSEIFQIAIMTRQTDVLLDDSQDHTLMLRVTLQFTEVVGSPPAATTFIEPVTDSAPEVIWNGGINSFTEDSWAISPLMPGETGTVCRFTVCDFDSNEHQLIINRFFVQQSEFGTALSSDLTSLNLYRLNGFARTLLASRTPNVAFERGSGMPGEFAMPAANDTAIVIPDDTCVTFELDAVVSPFALKGHTIQPQIQIRTQEPGAAAGGSAVDVDPTVEPVVRTSVPILIGKALIELPDTHLIDKPGVVSLNVRGVQLPGLGTLQVGPSGKLQYDPRVIMIKEIGASPDCVGRQRR